MTTKRGDENGSYVVIVSPMVSRPQKAVAGGSCLAERSMGAGNPFERVSLNAFVSREAISACGGEGGG
jgi:hypothetical protein